jgi:hypothetical protein
MHVPHHHLHPLLIVNRLAIEYLVSRKFHWPRLAVLQSYMVLGGIPYYLSLLDPRKNVPDNIDSLFFSSESELEGEFQRLFKSLFKSANTYMEIIRLLSTHRDGFTRKEISEKLGALHGIRCGQSRQDEPPVGTYRDRQM